MYPISWRFATYTPLNAGCECNAGDKRDLLLPLSQRKLPSRILETGTPTIVVLATGSAINPLADNANAVLQAWYPGETGGKALADIIFGKVSPSGKLPVTFYEDTDKLPPFADYSMKNRTYRYVEGNVLYPFGFGLTYSSVCLEEFKYEAQGRAAKVRIKNTESRECSEVLQIYVRYK